LPIFVVHDNSDVWVYPELFDLDDKGNPQKVSGVPPDYFSKTGQLWGNPHFNLEQTYTNRYSTPPSFLGLIFLKISIHKLHKFIK